jgi:hypothetical protein
MAKIVAVGLFLVLAISAVCAELDSFSVEERAALLDQHYTLTPAGYVLKHCVRHVSLFFCGFELCFHMLGLLTSLAVRQRDHAKDVWQQAGGHPSRRHRGRCSNVRATPRWQHQAARGGAQRPAP